MIRKALAAMALALAAPVLASPLTVDGGQIDGVVGPLGDTRTVQC
ncbi:hypothetical protein [Novosphingobium sp. CECT 9465]|nr:hypothetical protein [Novosphingobium sp. CECT 9465]